MPILGANLRKKFVCSTKIVYFCANFSIFWQINVIIEQITIYYA